MVFDLHTHHDRCGHAVGAIQEYIEAAIKKGLTYIGISDHSPLFYKKEDHYIPQIAMANSEFSNYVAEIIKLKQQYSDKIEVLLGVESDYIPEYIDLYRQIYKQYPFDYIIGSVHSSPRVNGVENNDNLYETSIFNPQRWESLNEFEMIKEKENYYLMIEQSAKCGVFDILGHVDGMKSNFPMFSELDFSSVEKALAAIAEADIVIEVNTSGKLKKCGGWYPADEILERAHFYGVKVTFGSDAHTPDRVADDWELVCSKLKGIGYKEWAIFRNRQRDMIPIE